MASDTSPAARAAQIAALNRFGAERRMMMAWEMSEAARELAIEGEMRVHPEWSRERARRVVLGRILGEELAARVWPAPAP